MPKATEKYGLPDGRPRISTFTWDNCEDVNELINLTYQQLIANSKPALKYTVDILDASELWLGDTVTTIRHDLGFAYKDRVSSINRDLLNESKTTVEIGAVTFKSEKERDEQTQNQIDNTNSNVDQVQSNVGDLKDDVDNVQEDLESTAAEAQRRIDAVKQTVADTQADMTKVMNNGGNNKIEWSPNLMNATQMKIHTSYGYWLLDDAGAGFHKNDGTVMNGLSADGRIYADSITGNVLTGTTINGGTVNGGIIDGAQFVAGSIKTKSYAQFLNSAGQVSTSVASYGISTPALTVDGDIDRAVNANIQYLHVSGNISGNGSGLYLQGPVYVDGKRIGV